MKMVNNINIEFNFRNKVNLKTLPANHLMKLDTLKFNFVEYKVLFI